MNPSRVHCESETGEALQLSQVESKNKIVEGIRSILFRRQSETIFLLPQISTQSGRVRCERVFTILLRLVAAVGTIASFGNDHCLMWLDFWFTLLSIVSVIVVFWVLALWRSLPLRLTYSDIPSADLRSGFC